MSRLALNGGAPIRSRPFPSWPIFGKEEEEAVLRSLRSGSWWHGEEVTGFEEAFAAMHHARFGITVTSGTAALRVALLAAGIRAGDEVIVPPYTFLATATAVLECNAVPVFVDVEPHTYNLDPDLVEAVITDRTKAVIPVHFAGRAARLDRFLEICRRHSLVLIEDAAHAHGGAWKGQGIGSIGDLGCFSFQASKNLNCGEGGIVLTNDESLAAECRAVHNFGRRPGGAWYEHNLMSTNLRMTELQAALLSAQLTRLTDQTQRRQSNADRLTQRLGQIPGIAPQVRGEDETIKAYHLYLYRFDADVYGCSRERFCQALNAEGVPATEGYKLPLHHQPIFAKPDFGPYDAAKRIDYTTVSCPVAERACVTEGSWFLHNVLLGDERDTDEIADAFEKVYEQRHELSMVPV